MPLPISSIPARPRRRRKSPAPPPGPAPVGPLTLVSGTYDPDAYLVRLIFNRAINIASIHPAQFSVDDPTFTESWYEGSGPVSLINPTTVQISLLQIEGSHGSEVTLTASASNGIVAADDGSAWNGVTDFPLE